MVRLWKFSNATETLNETQGLEGEMLQWQVEMKENHVKRALSKFDKAVFQILTKCF